ncbi:MAG: hypothetical protein HZA93_10960 [Verrucomicrobia bacterium]|nr:hypothetical protein [Verrucomicrobiota bacterium]
MTAEKKRRDADGGHRPPLQPGRWFLILFAWLFALESARAADTSSADRVVSLPPFLVEETDRGPPWRYAEVPGFEVLARCGDSATRTVVLAYIRLHHLLGVVLPEDLRLGFSEPRRLILYADDLQPAASKEVFSQLLSREDRNAPPADEGGGFGGRGGIRVPSPVRRVSFMPNLRLSDADATYVFTIVREQDLNTDTLYLTSDYLTFLLKNRVPALPWWFVTGFLATYRDMTFRDGTITLKPLQWISEVQTAALKKDPKTATPPVPLDEFFRGDLVKRDQSDRAAALTWTSQGSLLLRWALDEQHPERREALWKFVARAGYSYSSEKLFAECFGLDFAAVHRQLTGFLPTAVRQTVHFELPRTFRLPEMKLRDASPAEIGRIKGDWERLEVGYVKEHFPDVAGKYLEQARRTLVRAYELDQRDPRLLAALGLYACEAGDEALARDYLEAAARSGELRARAWVELARLRHAAAVAALPPGGKLGVTQASSLLTPLFAARRLNPPLVAAYELIADVWSRCELPPTRGHLAVLDEGVALFPRQAELVYRTASLYLERGWPAEARNYLDLGLQIAPDEKTRARFVELQSRLDPAK